MLKRLIATIEIARPHNMLAAAVCAAAGYYLSGGRSVQNISAVLIFTGLVTGLGYLINDYYDADIDRINKPRRPIPSGKLAEEYVRFMYWSGSLVLTLAMFRFLQIRIVVLMILWEAALLIYAMRAKRLPLVGNLLVSAVASSAFLVGALASENPRAVAFPIIFAFLFFMGRELVKGAEDIQGDRTAGARTMAVRIGVEKTVFFASCLFLTCVLLAPLPVLLERYGRFYALIMELIVVPGLVIAVYLVLNNPRRVILNRVNWLLKIEMFFGIVAMGLGKT